MQLVQFSIPNQGRGVGTVRKDDVVALADPSFTPQSVVELAQLAIKRGTPMTELIDEMTGRGPNF